MAARHVLPENPPGLLDTAIEKQVQTADAGNKFRAVFLRVLRQRELLLHHMDAGIFKHLHIHVLSRAVAGKIAVRAELLKSIPLGTMGKPEDVAQAVVFLVNAPYITGQVLAVDGGMAM